LLTGFFVFSLDNPFNPLYYYQYSKGKHSMKTWNLSEILRQKMGEEGLSYSALAHKLGLPIYSTWRFMTGQAGLNLRHIERLMEHYGLCVVEAKPKRQKGKGKKHGKLGTST